MDDLDLREDSSAAAFIFNDPTFKTKSFCVRHYLVM
jgi:hypothetical protein